MACNFDCLPPCPQGVWYVLLCRRAAMSVPRPEGSSSVLVPITRLLFLRGRGSHLTWKSGGEQGWWPANLGIFLSLPATALGLQTLVEPCPIIFDFVFSVGTENLNGGSPAYTASVLTHPGTSQAPSPLFTEEETQKLDLRTSFSP